MLTQKEIEPDIVSEHMHAHTPEGRRPRKETLRTEIRWLPLAVGAVIVLGLTALYIAAGWLALIIGVGLAFFAYVLGGASLWGAVLIRERDHHEIETIIHPRDHPMPRH